MAIASCMIERLTIEARPHRPALVSNEERAHVATVIR